ncbi:hypothetical protein HMI56_005538, partial [Coelomomyces lativittatus]
TAPSTVLKESQLLTIHDIVSKQPQLLISIQRTQYQSRCKTIKSPRFILRVIEALIGALDIAFLYISTFTVNYTYVF